MNSINLENIAELCYSEEGILTMRMHKKSNIDIDEAKKIHEAASQLSGDKVHCNLVDIRNMTFMSSEARKFFGVQNKKTVKAIAVISNAAFHKPLINLYMKFSRPSLPTKFFNEEAIAKNWLKEQLIN